MITASQPDPTTARWMRDASDDLAVRNGCWFDESRGQFVVDWMKDYLRLYEGEWAGLPLDVTGHWTYGATMRLFGWVRHSDEWGRTVRRFRSATLWVAKKNMKSPTLAAWTVYLAFGDGEQGQKVFPTAKDGAQIRENVVRHIHEMILRSPDLLSECKINKTTGNVLHKPSSSLIMPLSSDNVASQKSKEGLNGSVVVDEVHIVDRQHMRRISRAGISRAEPLQIEVSTAGDEPESYGFARFQYAESVIAGRIEDDTTLAIIYAAPQDVSDEDIHADPVKFGRMANPAWGHTVKQSEFMSDYNRSKAVLSDFADFKKYRLNIWQQSSNPWLSIHDWQSCSTTKSRPPADAVTYGGLDLSRTTDLTAWLLYQPGDNPKCWGHYWCPRGRAVELSESFEIPLLDWAAAGWVTLNDERVIDRGLIHARIKADARELSQLRYVGYDPYNADDTVKYCTDELDLEMVEVRQGVQSLSAPSKYLAELVVSHLLDHSNDPVLAWMLTNTSVKADENGNIKPVKTVGGKRKHIDGIVALIMAVYTSQANADAGDSIYSTPGNLSL